MSDYHQELAERINSARAHIKDLKKVAPYLFGEWQRLQCARAACAAAQKELSEAEKAWVRL